MAMNTMLHDLSVLAGRSMDQALRYAYVIGCDATIALALMAGLVIALGLASAARPRRWNRPALVTWQRP